jgi:hypothetical protein
MVMATVALPASIMAAIWAGVSSVAARRNTPVPSIRASKAVEVALRLSSTTTIGHIGEVERRADSRTGPTASAPARTGSCGSPALDHRQEFLAANAGGSSASQTVSHAISVELFAVRGGEHL